MSGGLTKILRQTALPLVLGLGVAIWLIHNDIDTATLRSITLDTRTVAGLLIALLFAAGRDAGLAWRFYIIADGALTWRRALRTDIMCAFTSAITPSVVGGSALAIFYLNQEGIRLGRATTLTLTTLFLDELFFVVFCPIIILLLPQSDLFGSSGSGLFIGSIKVVFWLVYAGIVIWTTILYLAIIARPEAMRRLLVRLASAKVLRRFRRKIYDMSQNMVSTSHWVKGRDKKWWLQVFGATVLSWFSRYFVVNALFFTFVPAASGLLVFGRQFVVWVVLMVSPTPGGSGISEWLFATYYGDLIGNVGMAAIIALIWRFLSYYIYLITGATLLPAYFGERARKKQPKP